MPIQHTGAVALSQQWHHNQRKRREKLHMLCLRGFVLFPFDLPSCAHTVVLWEQKTRQIKCSCSNIMFFVNKPRAISMCWGEGILASSANGLAIFVPGCERVYHELGLASRGSHVCSGIGIAVDSALFCCCSF